MNPLERLRYHVSGAIERGEAVAIVEQPHTTRVALTPSEPWPFLKAPVIAPKQPAKARTKRKARKPATDAPEALL